jgi:hypothetical protein
VKAQIGEKEHFIGRVIGRRILGKSCMFLDLVDCPRPEKVEDLKEKEKSVHGTGNHVTRENALSIGNLDSESEIYNVMISLAEDGLDQEQYNKLCNNLN